ncbi:uncharacterized protein JCM6883_003134 [Sporobolomyces salmoneus]|uniref:uncharacterized protein n=1 Tax=Sporobolomyces salmoneus TaxID=183962 RepID=UPI003179895F
MSNVRDLLKERRNTASPLPPPSPGLSESGFSTFVDSPATIHSPIFNFAHHHQFDDEPSTPEQHRDRFDEGDSSFDSSHNTPPPPPLPLPNHPPPRLGITTDLDDRLAEPRSPQLPASPSNNTENFSDCSPSPSIASVRMAKVALVPHRRNFAPYDHSRLSAASSMLSGSIAANDLEEREQEEEEEEDDRFRDSAREEWTEGALEQSSFVEDLPKDLAKIMSARYQPTEDGTKTPVPTFSSNGGRLPTLQVPRRVSPPPAQVPTKMQKSDSQESELSNESWKEDLDAAVKHLESDPNLKPDADAMQRMKSILGPKLKMVSKAPWDSDLGDDEPLASALPSTSSNALPSRRSNDILSRHTPSPSNPSPATASKPSKERKENVKPAKSRARSFSVLTSRKNNNSTSAEEVKEREEALQGLGLGLSQVTSTPVPESPSKRSLKGLVKSYSGLPSCDSYYDLTTRAKSQLDFSGRRHGSAEEIVSPVVTIVSERQRVEAGQLRKSARAPPPVTFDLVSAQNIPRSAPPTVSTFARSESHASLIVRRPSPHPSSSMASLTTSSGPSTPSALIPAPPSPTSPDATRGGSYFTAVPGGGGGGGSSQSPTAPYSFGHHLISLEEARHRDTENRRKVTPPSSRLPGHDSLSSLSSKARTRESTLESVGTRKHSTTPPALQSSNSSPATTVSSLPTPRSLKLKKSGFLKRMMGGSDKHDRFEVPTPVPILDSSSRVSHSEEVRTVLASSASIPSLNSVSVNSVSAPSSLSKATGVTAQPLPPSPNPTPTLPTSSSRVAFGPTPLADPNQRIRKGGFVAPSLSLRPVSMAFSAGLPSDFLANLAAAETANNASNLASSSEPVISPNAPSFKSAVSNASASVFDEAVLSPSALPITPLTPTFPLSPLASPGPNDNFATKYVALQEEYGKAKSNWKTQQWELESQIRSLQIELMKSKEEKQKDDQTASDSSDSDKCSACGASKVNNLATPSVISRPRFKGQAGNGTLFGSASGINA